MMKWPLGWFDESQSFLRFLLQMDNFVNEINVCLATTLMYIKVWVFRLKLGEGGVKRMGTVPFKSR